ncbi:MAG: hypothetical protein Q9170_001811 [Blastenia crenularia]
MAKCHLAGIAIADLAGSDTSVFVGAFTDDYGHLIYLDPNTAPTYKATGLGISMLANRVSHWFDLRGASMTLDTACSASSSALHMACETLRQGSSKVALVSGANIMLEPEMMQALSTLNFLSPDGKSYMFDQRANGYARGEGVGTLILKPLSDALSCNDPIHAVIRNTGINQDGRTPGITLPSMFAQRDLIRKTYQEAGLSVSDTDFFEAHGTGTQAGDQTEAEALSKALDTSARAANRPLYVGSVKTLLGHCEGASGVAGVIHSVLALKAQCFLPNCHFQIPSDKINFQDWKIKVPTKMEHWTCTKLRRASVNSFGYGGTNVHAILEEAPVREEFTNGHGVESRQKILFLSAHEEESLQKLANQLASYTDENVDFDDLVYTLGQRRSLLRCRNGIVSNSIHELSTSLKSNKIRATRITKTPRICFVFTGQGAQWAQMGCQLLRVYPIYQATLQAADTIFNNLGAPWSLFDELKRDTKTSKIDEASLSQPICTALQVALVELLKSWDICPVAVVGHSSGEIAAAYCAGMLSLESAMTVAYLRGKFAMDLEGLRKGRQGGMIAVGLAREEVEPQLSTLKSGRATIACINSPRSVTVSGDAAAIRELHASLDQSGTFNRVLRVNVAYHSHHMKAIASKYADSLSHIIVNPANPTMKFSSSVFPGIPLETSAEYWVQNMLMPVQFSEAVQRICTSKSNNVDLLVEVGPHSALASPLKQICNDLSSDLRPTYFASLERKKSDLDSMLGLAVNLFTQGVDIDAGNVNFPAGAGHLHVLSDLPPYPWNHAMRYWHEGRKCRNYLHRRFPQHDLLGSMTDDCSELDLRWTNNLRRTELPWVMEHTLNGEPIFPGAGYLSMAIEAAKQKAIMIDSDVKGYTLRDVGFSMALIVPDTPDGIEVSLLLEPLRESAMASSSAWDTFRIISYSSDRKATEHCHGLISICQEPEVDVERRSLSDASTGSQAISNERYEEMVERFSEGGVLLGENFQLLSEPVLAGNTNTCTLRIPDTRSAMPYQYETPLVVRPVLLDGCLQVTILSIVNLLDFFDGPLLPTSIKEVFVSKDISTKVGYKFHAQGTTNQVGHREYRGHATVFDQTNTHVVSIKDSTITLHAATKSSIDKGNADDDSQCWNTRWKPDVIFFDQSNVDSQWDVVAMDPQDSAKYARLEKVSYLCLRKALAELPENERRKMLPHHQYYVKWAEGRLQAGDAGKLNYQTADWDSASEGNLQSLLDEMSETGAPEKMTARLGSRLGDVLRQQIDPLSIMMEDGLLDQYYTELNAQDRAYDYAARYVDLAAHKWPSLKILEIGAGTGSATSFVLKALPSESGQFRCSSYHFTDISAGFFEKARQKFATWKEYLDFKTLNVENDPEGQGFETEGYDLIVAANVLHATAKMETTMKHVHKLLRPGGKLVLVEVTNPDHLTGPLIFGLLPGWWMGVAEGRKDSPLLSESGWDGLFQRTGFTGLEICLRDVKDVKKYSLSMMVTTKREEAPVNLPNEINLIHVSQSGLPLAQSIASKLQPCPRIMSIDTVAPSETFYVLIDDAKKPILPTLREEQLKAFQRLFAVAKGLVWITFGGLISCENPEAGAVLGFMRTMRIEFGSTRLVTLDLPLPDSRSTPTAVAKASSFLAECFKETDGSFLDLEYAERDGTLMIPRLIKDEAANVSVKGEPETPKAELQPLWQKDRPLSLEMHDLGLLDSFQFVSDLRVQDNLKSDEVEIEIQSSALNFHDLMVATGQLADLNGFGLECSGVITKVGREVKDFRKGQRVCALANACFGTHTRTPQTLVCAIPESMGFEVAASIPSVFSTSYYSLFHATRLQPGETILIHSAAGGVGQACIKLASLIGATIFVTVGTPAKVEFLQKTYKLPRSHILNSRDLSFAAKIMSLTSGKGVDVIVNSLAGDALRESWRCIAMFGRFIELGKKDAVQNAHLGMAPFERSASFIAVGFDLFGAYKSEIAGNAMREVIKLYAKGKLTPIEPINTYDMSEIERAFRFMQSGTHMGKIVINAKRECSVPTVPKPLPGLRLREDASYLIVGGLTGIGAASAKWMASRWGAKHLILLSRHGLKNQGASDLISTLEEQGVKVEVIGCDVADTKQLDAALQRCSRTLPPICGLIQGAMVLQDSILENMSLEKWFAAVNPKIKGTKNLHNYFIKHSLELDFFVMLSSLGGLAGNMSQSNYAAGNTYQDALAYHRTAMGLPALTIDVGYVADTGWSAVNRERLATRGQETWAKPITTEHLLRLIEHNVLNSMVDRPKRVPVYPQVSIGIKEIRAYDARFSHIAASDARSPTQQLSAKEQVSLADRMAAAGNDPELLQTAILEAFSQRLSRLLDLPLEDIHHDDSLSGHGVDSLVAVEVRNWLGKEAGANIPMSEILNGRKTIEQMVKGIVADKLKM